MGTIADDLRDIMGARYGREVRQAIHDAIYDINEVAEGARDSATASASAAAQSASNALSSENSARSDANTASDYADLSHSWAVGGTGVRPGENTDNAKYYAESIKRGEPNGVASLDGNGRVPYSQLPESAMEFKGTWNANTNTPTLVAGQGTNGDFYVVSVGGTWNSMTFSPNDRVLFDGVTAQDWIRLAAGEVNSVNGQSGAVQLDADDIPFANTNTGISSTDVQGAIVEAYNHGSDGVLPAPLFDETVAYGIGDYVTYNNKTYRFIAIKSAGAWASNKAEQLYAMGAYVTAGKKANTTLGSKATAEGNITTSSGFYSHAEGSETTASGNKSHAEGMLTVASGECAHAEGYQTTASGEFSHAECINTEASAQYTHAEGHGSKARNYCSHAEGLGTQTGVAYQHVQGRYNIGKNNTLFEIGKGADDDNRSNAFEVDGNGNVIAAGTFTDGGGNVLRSGVIPVNPTETTGLNIWIVDE